MTARTWAERTFDVSNAAYTGERVALTVIIVALLISLIILLKLKLHADRRGRGNRRRMRRSTQLRRKRPWYQQRLSWWQRQLARAAMLGCVAIGFAAYDRFAARTERYNVLVRSTDVRSGEGKPSNPARNNIINLELLANVQHSGQNPEAPVLIIDGDTFQVAREKIRILDIDAPESYRSRCEQELELGLAAKERLRSLLDAGPRQIFRQGRDRYGRTLARVLVNGRDIGALLLAEGHALAYRPGAEAKLARLRQWCGPDANFGDKWSPVPS